MERAEVAAAAPQHRRGRARGRAKGKARARGREKVELQRDGNRLKSCPCLFVLYGRGDCQGGERELAMINIRSFVSQPLRASGGQEGLF